MRERHDEGCDSDVGDEGHPVQLVEELQVWFALQDETSVGVKDEEGPEDEAVEEGGAVDDDDDVSAGDEEATEGSPELGLLLKQADPKEAEDTHWNQQTWFMAIIDHYIGDVEDNISQGLLDHVQTKLIFLQDGLNITALMVIGSSKVLKTD